MAALKCPNPSCPFLFDPTQVPPGAVLTCPRCTMRFTLGGPAAPPVPAFDSTTSDDAVATPSVVNSRMMLVVGVGAVLAVIFAILALYFSTPRKSATNPDERFFRDVNLAVTVPPVWETDEALRKFGNVLAMKKSESSARFCLATRDFRTRPPQPGELRDGLVAKRLDKLFDDLDDQPPVQESWLGQPAEKVTFRGRSGENSYAGAGWAVGVHGRAYWFIAWSLESEYDREQADLEAVRAGCRLIDTDLNWKTSESGSTVLAGEGFHVLDGDRWWTAESDPTSEDPKAVMLLKAAFRSGIRSDRPPQAWAAVYKLGPSDDAIGTLSNYVKARYAKHFGIQKFVELSDEPQGDAPAAGMPATLAAMRFQAVHESANIEKLVVVNAVNTPSGVVGIEAWCPWSDRAKWEKRLLALASSLTAP